MTRTLASACVALMFSGLAFGCVVGSEDEEWLDEEEEVLDEEEVTDIDYQANATVSTIAKRPVRDSSKVNVVGVTNTTSLYLNVDDGTSFTSADNATTYVRSSSSVTTASHTTGYTLGVTGTVTKVLANYRADRGTAQGTIRVQLYNGTTLVATGPLRTLGAWTSYTDTFSSLSLPANADLRLKVTLTRTSTTGYLRYTQVWMNATVSCSTCISFANQVQPIFNARCTGCHGSTSPVLTSGSSYTSLVNKASLGCPTTKYVVPSSPSTSFLLTKLAGGTLSGCSGGTGHVGRWTSAEQSIVSSWISQGAKNN